MYTRGSSQQTFEIPNNNLDVKFERANLNEQIPHPDEEFVLDH